MDIVSACQWIFHQDTLRAELPTVTTGGTCPVSGVSNLASTEYLDTTFTGTFGAYSKRCYHLIPTTSLDHLVVVDGGHETTLTDGGPDTFGMQHVVRTLVAAGYAVLIAPMEDGGAALHDTWGLSYSPSVNPMERFYGPVSIAMNNVATQYSKRSMTGLSGGGWMVANYAGLDPRINHATIAVRGTAPVANGSQDWEQTVLPTGFTFAQLYEGFYRLSASPGRRLWIAWNPLDTALFGDASHFNDSTLAPIRSEFPSVDLQYMQDPDLTAEHFYTQWTIDNALLPALSRSLVMTISNVHATTGTIADDPSAQINKDEWNAEHTLTMATGKLLGRSTAGTGVVEEITVGTNLTLAGGVLDASGGGGGSAANFVEVTGDGSTTDTLTHGAYTKISASLATVVVNDGTGWDVSGKRFNPSVAGVYQFNYSVLIPAITAGVLMVASIYKNGALLRNGVLMYAGANGAILGGACCVKMNGSTDFVELFVFQNEVSADVPTGSLASQTWFQAIGPLAKP